jgi:hypothetical protein
MLETLQSFSLGFPTFILSYTEECSRPVNSLNGYINVTNINLQSICKALFKNISVFTSLQKAHRPDNLEHFIISLGCHVIVLWRCKSKWPQCLSLQATAKASLTAIQIISCTARHIEFVNKITHQSQTLVDYVFRFFVHPGYDDFCLQLRWWRPWSVWSQKTQEKLKTHHHGI